jgi:hypothetical protein
VSRGLFFASIALAGIGLAFVPRAFKPKDRLPGFPSVMLWSWEHSDDLRFIDPRSTGLAFLAGSIWLSSGRAEWRPRLAAVQYPPGTSLMAVVRFESPVDAGLPDRAEVIQQLRRASQLTRVRALQIDFDARESQRIWYAALLQELRAALPPSMPVVITALVSWCDRDDWIRDLPAADASPMMFRMGTGVQAPPDFLAPLCQGSVGVSTDELPVRIPAGRRIFFFHPGHWTPATYEAVMSQAKRWQ